MLFSVQLLNHLNRSIWGWDIRATSFGCARGILLALILEITASQPWGTSGARRVVRTQDKHPPCPLHYRLGAKFSENC